MSNEVLGKAVDHMGELQKVSLKTLDMIVKNADGLNKLAEIIKDQQDNLNSMATKVLELEKKIESLEGYANREL
jgi:prefoldin subunit 5